MEPNNDLEFNRNGITPSPPQTAEAKDVFGKYCQVFNGNGDYCFEYLNETHAVKAMEEYASLKSKEQFNKGVQEAINVVVFCLGNQGSAGETISELEKLKKQ